MQAARATIMWHLMKATIMTKVMIIIMIIIMQLLANDDDDAN